MCCARLWLNLLALLLRRRLSCLTTLQFTPLVAEDKGVATLWRQDAECYVFRVDSLMRADCKHWQETGITPQAALEGMRATFDWASKHCSLPLYPRKKWFSAGLPYLYGSIKSRCYKSFAHIRTKPAHSCYRKIVSWFWHPAKHWLRRCNGAVSATVRLLKPGLTVSNLKLAVAELREMHGFACGSLPWNKLVANKRYVDDLCMVSRHFCRQCLSDLPSAAYPSWISWEEAAGDATAQAWLGVVVETGHGGVRVVPRLRDEPFLRGETSEPVKFALPPCQLRPSPCSGVRKSCSLGSAPLDPDALAKAVAGEAAVWLKYGYPPKMVKAIWAKQQRLPQVSRMRRAIMQRAMNR